MKRMYMMLCLFGLMAGCDKPHDIPPDGPPTIEQVQTYEKQEAITIYQDNWKPVKLSIICVDGVQYYYQRTGHSAWFAPVVDKTTLQFKPCGIP